MDVELDVLQIIWWRVNCNEWKEMQGNAQIENSYLDDNDWMTT